MAFKPWQFGVKAYTLYLHRYSYFLLCKNWEGPSNFLCGTCWVEGILVLVNRRLWNLMWISWDFALRATEDATLCLCSAASDRAEGQARELVLEFVQDASWGSAPVPISWEHQEGRGDVFRCDSVWSPSMSFTNRQVSFSGRGLGQSPVTPMAFLSVQDACAPTFLLCSSFWF